LPGLNDVISRKACKVAGPRSFSCTTPLLAHRSNATPQHLSSMISAIRVREYRLRGRPAIRARMHCVTSITALIEEASVRLQLITIAPPTISEASGVDDG